MSVAEAAIDQFNDPWHSQSPTPLRQLFTQAGFCMVNISFLLHT